MESVEEGVWAVVCVLGSTALFWIVFILYDYTTPDARDVYLRCYSGGSQIYDGMSKGGVRRLTSDRSYFFTDARDDRKTIIRADCVLKY